MDHNLTIKFSNVTIYDSTGQRPNVSLSTQLNVYCFCLALSFLYYESCAMQCIMSRLSPCFWWRSELAEYSVVWLVLLSYAVTVTMRRNDLLASHVTLTKHHAIRSYPLASLSYHKIKQLMLKSVMVNCQ